MPVPICVCFVGFEGGRPKLVKRGGCSKVERRGKGAFLLDLRAPAGASVRFSGLPPGYQANSKNVEEGFAIEVFDNRGRPVDQGFQLVIDPPEGKGQQEERTHRLTREEMLEVRRIEAKGTKGTSGTESKKEKG